MVLGGFGKFIFTAIAQSLSSNEDNSSNVMSFFDPFELTTIYINSIENEASAIVPSSPWDIKQLKHFVG